MNPKPISLRDEDVLDFIVEHAETHGYPPTVREIGEHLGMTSPSTVQNHLLSLIEAGYLERTKPHSPRALRVLHRPGDATI